MKIEEAIKTSNPLDLPTKTVINLMFTTRILEEAIAGTLKDYELTIPQYNVLRILRGQKGTPANLSCIQERMVDKNSNTTRLVDKLITKEYVNRQVCPHNRRKVEIEITPEGLSLLEKLDPLTRAVNEVNTSNLTEAELLQLNELLDKLRTHE